MHKGEKLTSAKTSQQVCDTLQRIGKSKPLGLPFYHPAEPGEDRDAIKLYDSVLAASPPPPSGAAWGVKPLVWHFEESKDAATHIADWMAGTYIVVARTGEKASLRTAVYCEEGSRTFHPSLDEAKAAAQADYEARIRSALTPAPSYAEGVEAAAKEAHRLVAQWASERMALDTATGIRLARAGKPPAEDGWLDISTAPKDGSMILLFNAAHREPAVMGWTSGFMEDVYPDGCWTDAGNKNQAINAVITPGYFQFWRPLPAPPNVKGARTDGL